MNSRHVSAWMWSEAVRMLDEADRISQQFFRVQQTEYAAGAWEPPVDVYETEADWTVLVALPGVPAERIRYRLEGDALDVVAERSVPPQCAQGLIRRKEVPHGRFARSLRFRAPPQEITRAVLKDGCLILTLSKPRT
jgi:HSP20 family molecular chaperone IbpA